MSTLLRGAPVAERLTLDLSRRSAALRHRGVIPTLAILRVGSSPGDLAYEKSAAARCARCGIEVRRLFWDSAAPLADAIRAVNADPSIHGCLLLRPLADRAAEAAAGQLLLPDKDVDGMTPGSLAGLLTGQSGFAPCTAQACLELLDYYEVPLAGRRAVVVARRSAAAATQCHRYRVPHRHPGHTDPVPGSGRADRRCRTAGPHHGGLSPSGADGAGRGRPSRAGRNPLRRCGGGGRRPGRGPDPGSRRRGLRHLRRPL